MSYTRFWSTILYSILYWTKNCKTIQYSIPILYPIKYVISSVKQARAELETFLGGVGGGLVVRSIENKANSAQQELELELSLAITPNSYFQIRSDNKVI